MMKSVRTTIGGILVIVGIVFTILPGSILLVIGGLILLSVDYPRARNMLTLSQRYLAKGARKLDSLLLRRKLR